LVATDIVAVASFVLPLTKLSKAKIATSISNLADNTLLTLTKFKVAGRVGFEVLATTGKSTFEIIQDAGTLTLKVADAAIYWSVGQANRVFFGKSWALATDAGGYILRAGDGEILKATELMRNANGILLKMEKTIAGKKEEVLALVVKGVGKYANWVEITGITSKIEDRMPHVDYLDFKGNGFEGCHTQNAMNQYLANNIGWTGGFVDANGSAISLIDNVPIEAYPWVKDINGNIFTKTNGAQKTINGVQYGKASFFPKNWSTAKLKAEVEYAISNNHGLVTGNTYKGFSTDGTVEIWFYYNTSNGSIISFFPKVN
jgi:hypothetical protein